MATDGDTRSDESLPPINTRWSDDPAPDAPDGSDDLAPPFVPGRGQPAPDTEAHLEAGERADDEMAGEPAVDEAMVEDASPDAMRAPERAADEDAGEGDALDAAGWPTREDATDDVVTPFVGMSGLESWDDEEDEDEAGEAAPGGDEDDVGEFEQDVAAYASEEPEEDYDELPIESFEMEGRAAGTAEPVSMDDLESAGEVEEWSPVELYGEEEEEALGEGAWATDEAEPEPTEPTPAESAAEEIAAPWSDAEPAPEPEPETPAAAIDPQPAASSPEEGGEEAEKLAAHLERLARLVREEGPEALRSEMDSADRFNAALAGLLAGYLARL